MDQSYSFKDTNVLVMGLGRFGGGLGVTRFLLREGARVILNDRSSADELATPLKELGDHRNLTLALGHHDPSVLDNIDILVVNPAVPRPWDNAFINAAAARGIRVTTEIEIAYRLLNPDRVIAITGSAGKSTTSAMTHHALRALDIPSVLGGNIGGSLLDQLDTITPDTTIVLELSSAMLYWLWGRSTIDQPTHPAVSCVTSYNPNHLDWHADETHYLASKKLILTPDRDSVLPESLHDWANLNSRILTGNDAIEGCAVPGHHNAMNASFAIACIRGLHPHLSESDLIPAVQAFTGLPHRLHRSFEHQGVIYFDDSKSTTPQATLLAIKALETIAPRDRIHLIAGGYDKGSDLTPIANLAPELAGLYCIGTTAQSIVSASRSNAFNCNTLDHAMHQIHTRTQEGHLVLLSPGCASWDQFENYEQRGRRFVELAKAHAEAIA
jgi:UDP-N-acetylmuramoylalanine--D-glutamate ligase